MTHQTAILSTLDAYLETGGHTTAEQLEELAERQEMLRTFSHPVMLELAFPEVGFAIRWCCLQQHSRYRTCMVDCLHCHLGSWTNRWFVKTDYNFGFNEWYFSTVTDRNLFLEFAPGKNWGENSPIRY